MANTKWMALLAALLLVLTTVLVFMGSDDAMVIAIMSVGVAVLSLHER